MKRAIQMVAVFLLSLTLGLHWVVLQSVAWTTMLVERTCQMSFREAVQTTFDGQHPCTLCQVVQAGKSVGKSTEAFSKLPRLDLTFLSTGVLHLQAPCVAAVSISSEDSPISRLEAPLLEPPRSA